MNQGSGLKLSNKDSSFTLETSDHILNEDLEHPMNRFELKYQIFGEILGLFIGIGFVSLFEIIEIFLKFFFMLYKQFNSSRSKPVMKTLTL